MSFGGLYCSLNGYEAATDTDAVTGIMDCSFPMGFHTTHFFPVLHFGRGTGPRCSAQSTTVVRRGPGHIASHSQRLRLDRNGGLRKCSLSWNAPPYRTGMRPQIGICEDKLPPVVQRALQCAESW